MHRTLVRKTDLKLKLYTSSYRPDPAHLVQIVPLQQGWEKRGLPRGFIWSTVGPLD